MSNSDLPMDLRRAEYIPVSKISPHPMNTRKEFDSDKLDELGDSIDNWGLLQPIRVTPGGDKGYYVVFGERRLRAAKKKGIDKIPAEISENGLAENLTEMLIEDVHREELSAVEKGRGAYQVFLSYGVDWNPEHIARIVHSVYNKDAVPQQFSPVAPGATAETPENGQITGLDGVELIKHICSQIGKSPRTIRGWLEAISVSNEVQVKVTRESNAPAGQTLARLSKIESEELQSDAYDLVIEEELNKSEASKMVTDVRAKERDVESVEDVDYEFIVDNGDSGESVVTLEVTEQEPEEPESFSLAVDETEPQTVGQEVDVPIEEAESSPDPQINFVEDDDGESVFIFNDATETIRQQLTDQFISAKQYLNQPEQKRRTTITDSSFAHLSLAGVLVDLACPVEDANNPRLCWVYENDVGETVELSIVDAIGLAHKQYMEEVDEDGVETDVDLPENDLDIPHID